MGVLTPAPVRLLLMPARAEQLARDTAATIATRAKQMVFIAPESICPARPVVCPALAASIASVARLGCHAISRPAIVPLEVENASVSTPRRCSMVR